MSLINFVSDTTCNISFNIISHNCVALVSDRFNLDLALEKDLTGIITAVFKLLFNLF